MDRMDENSTKILDALRAIRNAGKVCGLTVKVGARPTWLLGIGGHG